MSIASGGKYPLIDCLRGCSGPRRFSASNLWLMRRIDELHLNYPFAGSLMLRDMLGHQGLEVGRRHIRTLMRRMGIEAIYRRPNTSKPAPGHRIYPYLLRGLAITRPNQVWTMDITYIPMARGFVYLAAVVDWFSRRVLGAQPNPAPAHPGASEQPAAPAPGTAQPQLKSN